MQKQAVGYLFQQPVFAFHSSFYVLSKGKTRIYLAFFSFICNFARNQQVGK